MSVWTYSINCCRASTMSTWWLWWFSWFGNIMESNYESTLPTETEIKKIAKLRQSCDTSYEHNLQETTFVCNTTIDSFCLHYCTMHYCNCWLLCVLLQFLKSLWNGCGCWAVATVHSGLAYGCKGETDFFSKSAVV